LEQLRCRHVAGRLWLDQDGTGITAPILLAVFTDRPAITSYHELFG
jgi:hypothetical protein